MPTWWQCRSCVTKVDVDRVHEYLRRVGAEHLGLILKIETTAAFARLPEILLHADAIITRRRHDRPR